MTAADFCQRVPFVVPLNKVAVYFAGNGKELDRRQILSALNASVVALVESSRVVLDSEPVSTGPLSLQADPGGNCLGLGEFL